MGQQFDIRISCNEMRETAHRVQPWIFGCALNHLCSTAGDTQHRLIITKMADHRDNGAPNTGSDA